MKELTQYNYVVIFDGVCNLCEGSVLFLLKVDTHKNLLFTHNQSDFAKKVLQGKTTDTIFFLKDGKLFEKSLAAFEIIKLLPAPYKTLLVFSLLPQTLTDWLYTQIAKNRYQVFGKKDQCMIPTPELQKRFL